jgi:hypothetical protein
MTEQNQTPDVTTEDDTEGHGFRHRDDSGDDVEGHGFKHRDDDGDDDGKDDDTEGHWRR